MKLVHAAPVTPAGHVPDTIYGTTTQPGIGGAKGSLTFPRRVPFCTRLFAPVVPNVLLPVSQPSLPTGATLLKVCELAEPYPGANAVSTQGPAAVAVAFSTATPDASVVALPTGVARDTGEALSDTAFPAAAGAPFCSNCTLTRGASGAEFNVVPVMVEPMNASCGCATNLMLQLGDEEVTTGAGGWSLND